jgi:intracellular sulfur oxidation DsrE/DsrF family protein
MKSLFSKLAIGLAGLGLLVGASTAVLAADAKKHNLVIQVSDDNDATHALALNNVVNLQKDIGMDNINIEVVAYGPGLKILTTQSSVADRVKSLAVQNITFSACANTMANVEKKTGKKPELTEGVKVVPAGVVRIMELQEQGYSYVRP